MIEEKHLLRIAENRRNYCRFVAQLHVGEKQN